MAISYSSVMEHLDQKFTVIGRSEKGAAEFENQTGIKARSGGITQYLGSECFRSSAAIVCTNVEQLKSVALELMHNGVKYILLEKPGGINAQEIAEISEVAGDTDSEVYIAYNRRFYASVQAAEKLIKEDGGALSFNFEITEWSHLVQELNCSKELKKSWFLSNSSHVIDTAFFLGGRPAEYNHYHAGGLEWHRSSSIFSGAGVTKKGALFSYRGNWESAGRWSLDISTSRRRFIFEPLEELHIQEKGSTEITRVEIDNSVDISFKPGIFRQCKSFLAGNTSSMCSINDQVFGSKVFSKMAGYLD